MSAYPSGSPTAARSVVALAVAIVALAPVRAAGQAAQRDSAFTPRGIEFAGVPALNYDADEGFGYGVVAELYGYGSGGLRPYVFTLQPTVFLTTGGRREFSVFFDAPHLLPGWRVDAYLAGERQIASPYYGIGNDAAYDPSLDDDANPYWYRFGRTRSQIRLNVQRRLGRRGLRAVVGAGIAHVSVAPVPKDAGTTLLAVHLGTELPATVADGGWSNYLRLGLIQDTRDREVGPRRGAWTELMVQRVDRALGSTTSYTRWTVSDRRYFALTRAGRLVFANRLLLQRVTGDAPFYDLYIVESSFKQQEGLGGAKTLRGVLKNRFLDKGLFLWNAELRWRALEFLAIGRAFHVVLGAFLDSGRVWSESIRAGELLPGLHHGYGGGVRIGMGENFVAALDVGTSDEASGQIYVGLGYLY